MENKFFRSHLFCLFLAPLIFLRPVSIHAQKKNGGLEKSTSIKKDVPESKKRFFLYNLFHKVRQSVTVTKQDSVNRESILLAKSISTFLVYDKKIIRNIQLSQFTFKQIFTDTTGAIGQAGTRLLNSLHTNTNSWVIRNNLFFKTGEKLNPYLLADNERYLRSLEFIQDARIVVSKIAGNKDSVDIEVITKDYFSITGAFSFGADRQQVTLAETNLMGAGQKIQVTMLNDKNRAPNVGMDLLYSKTSIAHSFVTGTIGFSRINSDPVSNNYIQSIYLRADRPLISPYSKLAGGFELAFNKSRNTYNKPDSLFYNYRNSNLDLWAGYNLGVKRPVKTELGRRRTFIALRYMKRSFFPSPMQVGNSFNEFYNSKEAILGELTFFKQEFYKTNYIYGFGNTEDVPYGYNIAIATGLYRQLQLSRPYLGINANFYSISAKKKLIQYYFRNGLFSNNGHLEDITFILGASTFSRLHVYRRFKMRQYFKANFSQIFNRTAVDPLQINNALGLRYFNADSLKGTQRLSIYSESFLFSRYKLFGFLMAPFVFANASMLKGEGKSIFKSDIYTGFGGGIRTRNVNLIFGMIELRFIYFPRKAQDSNSFVVSFSTDIRLRYTGNIIRPPSIIEKNSEEMSSFY